MIDQFFSQISFVDVFNFSVFVAFTLCYAYQMGHPGKKLTFMGMELGQFIEWRFDDSLDWLLLEYPKHVEMQRYVRELNHFYTATPELYRCDDDWRGFDWVVVDDSVHSVAAFVRHDDKGNTLLCVYNFTPVPWDDYRLGSEAAGEYQEVFSTDEPRFGGTGNYRNGTVQTVEENQGRFKNSLHVKIPPYGACYLKLKPKA